MSNVEILFTNLGAGLFLAIVYISWLFHRFSQRMGEVTRMPPYYQWFNVGTLLIFIGTISYILQCNAALAGRPTALLTPLFALFAFYIPVALGIMIDVVIVFIYWGWIVSEQ
ncbi:MAG: hypothetical protein JW981_02265 [Anaerolineae bacterium]|nr:hypothetical protein [Anaerolineae bacterium]